MEICRIQLQCGPIMTVLEPSPVHRGEELQLRHGRNWCRRGPLMTAGLDWYMLNMEPLYCRSEELLCGIHIQSQDSIVKTRMKTAWFGLHRDVPRF